MQLRTLLCDGSLVIGYLNTIQPNAFTARQRRLNERVVAALRQRLVLEHRLASATVANASLEVALDAIGRAALIVDDQRHVIYANALGELALEELRGTLAAIPTRVPTGFDVVPISVAGSPHAYLVLKKSADLADLATAIATQLALGDRARSVFTLAAAGEPTKSIATRLDLAENTVEYHLGVIFRRLGISSRAELYQLMLERALSGRT